MPQERRHAAGFILYRLNKDQLPEYLLMRNSLHLTWGFPKGHMEAGETEIATAVRETVEETGLSDLEVHDSWRRETEHQVHRPEGGQHCKVTHYFLARLLSGQVQRSKEHDEHHWLAPEQALERLQFDELKQVLIDAETQRQKTDSCPS